jgi:hypothetical protein
VFWPYGAHLGRPPWDSEYGQIEHQANVFSATLLMPLDDFRRQIDPRAKVDLDTLSGLSDANGARPTIVTSWSMIWPAPIRT